MAEQRQFAPDPTPCDLFGRNPGIIDDKRLSTSVEFIITFFTSLVAIFYSKEGGWAAYPGRVDRADRPFSRIA
jgi:hypothetical protein